jgi:hypothetical protein
MSLSDNSTADLTVGGAGRPVLQVLQDWQLGLATGPSGDLRWRWRMAGRTPRLRREIAKQVVRLIVGSAHPALLKGVREHRNARGPPCRSRASFQLVACRAYEVGNKNSRGARSRNLSGVSLLFPVAAGSAAPMFVERLTSHLHCPPKCLASFSMLHRNETLIPRSN